MPDGGTKHLRSVTFEGLAETITSEITLAAILERAGEMIMMHACAVADPETGAVVALVAKSGTGKTTASSVLGRELAYITDETVAIRLDGTILPYPKPLSLKQPEGGAKLQVGPDELQLLPAPRQSFISAIVLLNRVTGGGRLEPLLEPVGLADAVLALVPDTSSQSAMDEPLQSLCRVIDRAGGVWKVTYSEAKDLAAALWPLLRSGSGHPAATPAEWSVPASQGSAGPVPSGWLRRVSPVDAIEVDGDLLVLMASEITRLSGIAPVMWHASACPVSKEDLILRIGEHHGLPDGYEAVVDAAVAELIGRGILEEGTVLK